MQMNTIELNIDKYESMLKEIGVLKTENEELKKRLLTSHNTGSPKLPTIDECYKAIPFPEDAREAAMFCAGIAECHKVIHAMTLLLEQEQQQ